MIETYKKLFSFLDTNAKRTFFYFVPLLLIASLLEIISIAAIIPLLSAAFDGSGEWANALAWAPEIPEDIDKRSLLYLFSSFFIRVIASLLIYNTNY